MLRDAFIIHDGFLNTTNQTSSDAFSARLAACDSAAFFIVVKNVQSQTGSITIQLEHSGDAVVWLKKNLSPEINAIALNTNAPTIATGYENGTLPTMKHGRLRITSTVPKPEQLHVCVYVALRDVDPHTTPLKQWERPKPAAAPVVDDPAEVRAEGNRNQAQKKNDEADDDSVNRQRQRDGGSRGSQTGW